MSNDPSGELDPQKTLAINHEGRVRVASLAKKRRIPKYVLASTCSVYGFQEGTLTEESKPNPLTTYSEANVRAENDILPLVSESFTPTVLRQATVYGLSPRMRFDLAINGMILGLFKEGKIPIMRDGKQWRPFIHVKDTVEAFIQVIESDPELVRGQIFNVGSNEQNYQIVELAQLIATSIEASPNFEWYGSPDKRSYKVSFDKIKNTLSFTPQYTPKEGAKEVYKALDEGRLNPDDPRTITVKWYKHLLVTQAFLQNFEVDGKIL